MADSKINIDHIIINDKWRAKIGTDISSDLNL